MAVHVSPDPAATARAAADRIAGLIDTAEDRFTLAVSGGSTPVATFEMLSETELNWGSVIGWLSDERWVPPGHERSNGAAAARALFDRVGAEFIRPMWSESMSPSESAAHYEASLRSIHGDRQPDVIMLGIGDDGHTASLFPGTQALEERERWFVANHVPQFDEDRLTATYPLLWRARLLLLIVEGGAKAEALRAVLDGAHPAGLLGDGKASIEWFVDEEAASKLG